LLTGRRLDVIAALAVARTAVRTIADRLHVVRSAVERVAGRDEQTARQGEDNEELLHGDSLFLPPHHIVLAA
jgi:hypothetical protein